MSKEKCPIYSIDKPKLSEHLSKEGDDVVAFTNKEMLKDVEREQKRLCKELRDMSGVGIFKCRETLEKVGWDVKKAYQWMKDNPDSIIRTMVD